MMKSNKQGFSLAELLIVLVIIGALAGVAVPKYRRVLETNKTMEAEKMLIAVRGVQEQRCLQGKAYLTNAADMDMLKEAGPSAHFIYSLDDSGGATATRSDGTYLYALRILSYKDGRICCIGDYCNQLNRNYPVCGSFETETDECLN